MRLIIDDQIEAECSLVDLTVDLSRNTTSWTLMVICRLLSLAKDPIMGMPAFRNELEPDVSKLRHLAVSVIGNEPDLGHAKRPVVCPAFLLTGC